MNTTQDKNRDQKTEVRDQTKGVANQKSPIDSPKWIEAKAREIQLEEDMNEQAEAQDKTTKASAPETRKELRIERAMLVYQGGIANVFQVECFNLSPYGRDARRLIQGAFSECLTFARGLGYAGVAIRTAQCNQAGNIQDATWSEDLEAAPFSDSLIGISMNCEF